MQTRNFDLIAFDWDGTLFDSTQIIVRCIQAAVRDVGGQTPSDEAASYVIGMSLMQALAHAAPDVPPEKYPELGRRYQHHYAVHANDIALFEGVLPLLDALKARGHLLAVATGKSRRGLDEALHSVELRGVFDASRTADETAGKPDPLMGEVVKAFVSLKEGFAPSEALRLELLGHARKKLGAAVAPKDIAFLAMLPRTRSGKIMRRLLKARELGLPEGDTSTLEAGA